MGCEDKLEKLCPLSHDWPLQCSGIQVWDALSPNPSVRLHWGARLVKLYPYSSTARLHRAGQGNQAEDAVLTSCTAGICRVRQGLEELCREAMPPFSTVLCMKMQA